MKTIVLTGGGTAGHVTANLALLPKLLEEGWQVKYIGTFNGIERELVLKEGIEYFGISSGKLRRYLSKENVTDVFRVVKGIGQAASLIKKIKPDVVFSKGGFVSVPVVLGAKINNVPVIIHESDMTVGLANKISMPFAKKICTAFPETAEHIKGGRAVNTGTPIREALFKGSRQEGLRLCGFGEEKPVVMMMGGSLGAVKINNCLRGCLEDILKDFQLVHICGKGNFDRTLAGVRGYKQFEYVHEELAHIFAAAEIVVSRAGSNSISEFLALRKPMLLIPLSLSASRGDQILNANSFQRQGFAMVLPEEEMDGKTLAASVRKLYKNRGGIEASMSKSGQTAGTENVMKLLRIYGR